MSRPGPVVRCLPIRMTSEAPWGAWLSIYLLLYFVFDLSTLTVLAAAGNEREIVGGVLIDLGWGLPLHAVALLPAAGALLILRALSPDLRPLSFRLTALAIFVLPALLLTLLVTGGDPAALAGVLPMHLAMGLLVLQPHRRSADTDPSMDQH